MKKLFMLISLVVVLFMSGCVSAPQDDYVTQEEYEELKSELEALKTYIDNLHVMGFHYENDPELEAYIFEQRGFNVNSQFNEGDINGTAKDFIDETKFPTYIFDEFGEVIETSEMMTMLTQKYIGVDSETIIDFQFRVHVYKPLEMSMEDFIVRICLMVMELEKYDYYTYGGVNVLYLQFNQGSSQYMKLQLKLLVDPIYSDTLHPAVFWEGLLDTELYGLNYNLGYVELLYNQYTENATFDGYVLPNYR